MAVEIAPIPVTEKSLLWDRMQHYMAELMPYGNFAPVDGVFQYKWFDLYWQDSNRLPFWAITKGSCAAFALVRLGKHNEMAEFYSFPEFRRTGVALDFAGQVLRRFPGPWELSEYRANVAAVSFWHRVIATYPFEEQIYVGNEGKERLRQTFLVPGGT